MLTYIYEAFADEIDCYNLPPDLITVRGIPYDILKLFKKTTLKSLLAYTPIPNRITFSFLFYAIRNGMVKLYEDKKGICWVELKPEYHPRELDISQELLDKAIDMAKSFYSEICQNAKGEYYQDLAEEFPPTFHEAYLYRLFYGGHFPFVEGYKYLIVGDDEGKSLALYLLAKGKVNITVADIDERIPKLVNERIKKINPKVLDTRLIRNKVWEKFDVVISYSLLNSSLNTLKDFLIGTTKDYGIVYMSMYPALFKGLEDIFTVYRYFTDWGFWITDFTPYFVRMVKIPELANLNHQGGIG